MEAARSSEVGEEDGSHPTSEEAPLAGVGPFPKVWPSGQEHPGV